MGLLFNPDQPGRKKTTTKLRKEEALLLQTPSQEEFGVFPIKHSPSGTALGVQRELLRLVQLWGRLPGDPKVALRAKLAAPSLTKKPSKYVSLVCGAANGRDILGEVLFSCRLSSSCLLLLLHFFDLSSLPSPSCLSFRGEMRFLSPTTTCTSWCQNPGHAWQCGPSSLGL